MKEMLMWFQEDHKEKNPTSFEKHLSNAAARFRVRHGAKANVCYVPQVEFDDQLAQVNGITLKPATNIRPHYFMVGVENGTA